MSRDNGTSSDMNTRKEWNQIQKKYEDTSD